MTTNEKAIAHLQSMDIEAWEESDRVYVECVSSSLQIAEDEVLFQASEYDRSILEEE